MNIKINGENEVINADSLTIAELLTQKSVKMPEMVTVEYNGEILDRNNFDLTLINDGDEIEFLYFMGGGHYAA